jgi:hypothetical protein
LARKDATPASLSRNAICRHQRCSAVASRLLSRWPLYLFGIVVSNGDQTPTGRTSDALRLELPDIFPEFTFEFVRPEELESERAPDELLFRVLGAEVQRESDGKTISEEATYDMVQTIQAAVDKIVAAAKAKGTKLDNPRLAEACAGVNAARQEALVRLLPRCCRSSGRYRPAESAASGESLKPVPSAAFGPLPGSGLNAPPAPLSQGGASESLISSELLRPRAAPTIC